MNLKGKISLALPLALLILAGCAGTRLALPPPGSPVDAEIAGGELSRYNAGLPAVRVNGDARLAGAGEVDYGARVESGVGARFDGFAGPTAKQVLSAACSDAGECEVYLPDDQVIYRDGTVEFAAWFASLLGGRVPLTGMVRSAWESGEGDRFLRLEDRAGRWQIVKIGRKGLPLETLYGEAGEPPNLKIAFSDFIQTGDSFYPGLITLVGENGEEKLALRAERVEAGPGKKPLAVKITVPEDTRIGEESDKLWEKMGIFR